MTQGAAIACCAMFYGLIAFENVSLSMCDSDPKERLVGAHVQTFLKIAFFMNLASFLISSSLFPYFDIYMNTIALKSNALHTFPVNESQKYSTMSRLYPYVRLLETIFRLVHIILGLL